MSAETQPNPAPPEGDAPEDDFYMENGFVVFTAGYLRRRGYCCENNCRHCPYREPLL